MVDDTIERRVDKIETRVEEHGKRLDKMDTSLQRIWERMDQHRDQQVRTQTLVEVVQKQVGEVDVKTTKVLEAVNNHQQASAQASSRNWEKAFWYVMTSIASIVATILIAKFVHF